MIDENMTVNQVIREHPSSMAVFNKFNIDSCCGGAASLKESAKRDGAPLDELISELDKLIAASKG